MNTRRKASLFGFGVALFAVAGCGVLLVTAGCGDLGPAVNEIAAPPFDPTSLRAVSAVLERRCGTLDCHGHVARPLRLYGQYGLRRYEERNSPNVENYDEYYSGGKEPTTIAELEDNYRSILALEPELVAKVFTKAADPEVLTIVRKARLREKHKGGLLWNKGDPGDVCMTNWLTGNTDTTQCEVELGHP
ncbi:MAG TPA: hypothetical protein VM694_26360, partial [Polyangium sp.]|nr:hypothetical protein [Polyangium sp.]